jgi:hypothetical protein
MRDLGKEWDGEIVRKWLESRFGASLNDQDRADKHGRGYEDDYDKAAAEEWVCRVTKSSDATNDQMRFGEWLKELLGKDEYRRVGVYDDRRFEREVRSYLRKLIKMTKQNIGFENTSRYQ